jgi:hypothetical protein
MTNTTWLSLGWTAMQALGLVLAASTACVNELPGEADELTETPELVNPSGEEEQALSMPACGTTLASFDGTAAKSNGANTGTGVACAGQGGLANGLQYQCVELVMRHFKRKWDLRWYGNAKTLLDNAPRSTVDVRSNGDADHPPVPGDMIVWRNGAYGHVALVTAVTADHVDIIEQNVSGNGKARLPFRNGRIGARWNNWVPAGWAHAKANHAAPAGGAAADDVDSADSADGAADCGRITATGGVVDDHSACVTLGGNPRWLRAVDDEGRGGLVWTHATDDDAVDNAATWNLKLARAGRYRVEAFIDGDRPTTTQARYAIRHDGVVDHVTVNQATARGWRSLGSFTFAQGGNQRVFLGDNTGEPLSQQKTIVFDAVRVTPVCATLKVVTDNAALNVRASPSTSAQKRGELATSATVERLDTVDGQQVGDTTVWHEVRAGNLRGFVTGAYLACP